MTGVAAAVTDSTVEAALITARASIVVAVIGLAGLIVGQWLTTRRIGQPKDTEGRDTSLAQQVADLTSTVMSMAGTQGALAETVMSLDQRQDATEVAVARVGAVGAETRRRVEAVESLLGVSAGQ